MDVALANEAEFEQASAVLTKSTAVLVKVQGRPNWQIVSLRIHG